MSSDMMMSSVLSTESGAAQIESRLLEVETTSLVSQLRVQYDKLDTLKGFLFQLRQDITSISPQNDISEATAGVPGLPLAHRRIMPVEMNIVPPTNVEVAGSFLLHTQCIPALNVDIVVEMPDDMFEERDIKNYTYHDKKRLFLSALAKHLMDTDRYSNIGVVAIHHDISNPALMVSVKTTATDAEDKSLKFQLRILARASVNVFQTSKLVPGWNNVQRRSHLNHPQPATPVYNASILADMFLMEPLRVAHAALERVPVAVDAIVLLKAWARRRGMIRQHDGFNGFLLTMIVIHLIQCGIVLPEMTCLQAIRSIFRYLAKHNLHNQPIQILTLNSSTDDDTLVDTSEDESSEIDEYDDNAVETDDSSSEAGSEAEVNDSENENDSSSEDDDEDDENTNVSTPNSRKKHSASKFFVAPNLLVPLKEYQAQYDCVIVCPSGMVNLAANVSTVACAELQREASLALTGVGLATIPEAQLGTLFSIHGASDERIGNKMSHEGGAAGATKQTIVHSHPAEGFRALFSTVATPLLSADRICSISLPKETPDVRAYDPQKLDDIQLSGQTESKPKKRKTKSNPTIDKKEIHKATTRLAEDHAQQLTSQIDILDANGLCDTMYEHMIVRRFQTILTQGLGDRVTYARVLPVYSTDVQLSCKSNSVFGFANTFRLLQEAAQEKNAWNAPLELSWDLDSIPPRPIGLWVLLHLHPINNVRLVDRGPNAEDADLVKAFKAFWGQKAELRRFADGSILQSVVWQAPLSQRQEIVPRIIDHLAKRHIFKTENESQMASTPSMSCEIFLEAISYAVESCVHRCETEEIKSISTEFGPGPHWYKSAATSTTSARSVLLMLERALENLPGVPLRVSKVTSIAPELRFTGLQPPTPHPMAHDGNASFPLIKASREESQKTHASSSKCPRVYEVIVMLESSAKWPDELIAIQQTKRAFYLRFKDGLGQVLRGSNNISCVVAKDSLDVFFGGYVWRIRLFIPKELALLVQGSSKSAQGVLGSTCLLEGYGSAFAELVSKVQGFVNVGRIVGKHEGSVALPAKRDNVNGLTAKQCADSAIRLYRHCVLRPRHAAGIFAFASYHPAYAPTVRLALHWLNAHMLLSYHLSIEAVELLVAHLFCDPRPFLPPHTPFVGFLRFLRLLYTFDFENQPLLVDVEGISVAPDRRSLWSRFSAVRGVHNVKRSSESMEHQQKGPAIYLVTPHERGLWRPQWTSKTPDRSIVQRLKFLAQQTENILSGWFTASLHMLNVHVLDVKSDNPSTNGKRPRHDLSNEIATIAPLWKNCFNPITRDFDLAIVLRHEELCRRDGLECGPALSTLVGNLCIGYPVATQTLLDTEVHSNSSFKQTFTGACQSAVSSQLQIPVYSNTLSTARNQLLPGFNPISLLIRELNAKFERFAFFFNGTGTSVQSNSESAIYVVFKSENWSCPPKQAISAIRSGHATAEQQRVAHSLIAITTEMMECCGAMAKAAQWRCLARN